MSKSKLDQLLKKREQLEAEIAQAKRNEKRKIEVAGLAEKCEILHFSDAELTEFFTKISQQKPLFSDVATTENQTAA